MPSWGASWWGALRGVRGAGDRVRALEAPPVAQELTAGAPGLRDADTEGRGGGGGSGSAGDSASASAVVEEGKVVKVLKRVGMTREEMDSAGAGDIVAIAGLSSAFVSHTLAHPQVTQPLSATDPTLFFQLRGHS